MKQPICLITPPSIFLMDARVFIALGILRVASVLEQAGHVVEHVDLNGIDNYTDAVRAHAGRSCASVFGLTATTPQMPATALIVQAIREVRPDARIILGGPHVTLANAAKRREDKRGVIDGRAGKAFAQLVDMFDVLVAGDGEDAIFHAIMPDAPKLIDGDDAASQLFLTNERYDKLPLPARHLVDVDSYHYSIDGVPAISLIAQLGCPYMCSFCGGRNSPMLRRIRTRTTESVVAEIRHLYLSYGVRGFMMYDDELNVNKQIVELMDAIHALQVELGVEFRLRGFIKSNLFTGEQAAAMYRAGFRWILVGFESGSPRILENIQKKATRDQNTECMEIARRHGLKVKALMSVGHAGESAETIQDTQDWLMEQRPDDFDCTVISTYPGTAYYDDAEETAPGIWTYTAPKSGDKLHAVEIDFNTTAEYYKGVPGEYTSYVYTDYLSADEIVARRDRLENEVRAALSIPFNAGAPGLTYEASMGQLPGHILRTSEAERDVMGMRFGEPIPAM
jgi:anaerobic magnesium-protoporphyrin IX monomethyl ester cyclase